MPSTRSATSHRPSRLPTSADAAEVLYAARCVIFDFDGPVCSVFAGHPAVLAADKMITCLLEQGVGLYAGVRPSDPMEVLRDAGHRLPVGMVKELGVLLSEYEAEAAETAEPTPGADLLIKRLREGGRTLAVASNNDVDAIRSYLTRTGLTGCFRPRDVHGRLPDPALMKPDPDCIRRALRSTAADPATAVMVGDSVSDLEAADRVGVRFVGFAVDQRHAQALRNAGATSIVPSWGPVVAAVKELST